MMRWIALAAACAALALAGCGSDDNSDSGGSSSTSTPASGADDGGGGGGGSAVSLSAPADGSKKFDQATATAKAGTVTVKFDNPSSVPHAVEIEGNGVEKAGDVVTSSDTSFSVDLKPGEYTYYCPVGDHRDAGMEGKLTVS
jgi:plastocyanin